MNFQCTGTIRRRSEGDKASRYFFTIPKEISDQIQSIMSRFQRKGRGSVRVKVRIGRLDRETSIFPDKKSGCYLLPIKAEIRKKLKLIEQTIIAIEIDLI